MQSLVYRYLIHSQQGSLSYGADTTLPNLYRRRGVAHTSTTRPRRLGSEYSVWYR